MEQLVGIASIAIIIFVAIVWFALDYKIEKLLNKVEKNTILWTETNNKISELNYKIEEMLRKGSSQTKQGP